MSTDGSVAAEVTPSPVPLPPPPNGLSDGAKFALTLLLAIVIPILLSALIYMLLSMFGFTNRWIFLGTTTVLVTFTLTAGFNRNGELEQSVGGIFNQLTPWVIPSGISWWVPRPLGQSLLKVSIDKKTLDRSVKAGKPYTNVMTRDGGQVVVGPVKTWHIVDPRIAGKFSSDNLGSQVDSLFDRNVRLFSLYFDSDEDITEEEDRSPNHRQSGLAQNKIKFSHYLEGREGITDNEGTLIPSDVREKAANLGIFIGNVDVNDVNEPPEVQQARNEAAAEHAQGKREQLDVGSIRSRVLELMWGTSVPTEIADLKKRRSKPLISEQEALRAVRAARKDLEDINVSGDAGDFTKSAALGRKGGKTK